MKRSRYLPEGPGLDSSYAQSFCRHHYFSVFLSKSCKAYVTPAETDISQRTGESWALILAGPQLELSLSETLIRNVPQNQN